MEIAQVSPAAANYYAIWPKTDRSGYYRSTIIGWHFAVSQQDNGIWEKNTPCGIRFHISLESEDADSAATAILCPDGSVNARFSGVFWPSTAAWLADPECDNSDAS